MIQGWPGVFGPTSFTLCRPTTAISMIKQAIFPVCRLLEDCSL